MVVYHGTNGSFNEYQFGRKSKRYYLLSDVDVEGKFDDGQFSYHCKTYAIRLVVKEDFTGNYFYDGDSVEMTKVKELQNNSHLVPNKGDSEAPIRSLLWYFKNVNPKRYYSLSVLK